MHFALLALYFCAAVRESCASARKDAFPSSAEAALVGELPAVASPQPVSRVLGTAAEDGDRDALEALYQATNGTGWTKKWDLLSTADHCSWYGVTCIDGRVTKLQVYFSLLVGWISD